MDSRWEHWNSNLHKKLVHRIFLNFGILQTHFGTGAYIAAGGAVLYADGSLISTLNDLLQLVGLSVADFEVGRYLIVEFTGCFVAVLFIVS